MVDVLSGAEHWLGRFLFQRSLAAVYLLAFLGVLNQFRPLLGERGLLPVPGFVRAVPFRKAPSLFHLGYSDRGLVAVAVAGIALSAAAVAGVTEAGPIWLSMTAWFLLWALYLSVVNVGRTFYGFGWESLLCETGFLAIFLGPVDVAPPVLVMWLIRWVLFRVEFGAGLIKLRGDPCWRNLTCLDYHHETQPMPNPLSWYFHHLPRSVHRVETLGNFAVQLVAPWFLFAPQPVAGAAAAAIIASQLFLVVSGNYAWLNWLTIVLALPAFAEGLLSGLIPFRPPPLASPPTWHLALVVALAAFVAFRSYRPIRNLVSRRQLMNFSYDPLHLVNTYGAFGSVTRERHEVVLEGTRDPEPDETADWREYGFKAKPTDPERVPPQIAPYHLRLDWLMWFVPLRPGVHPEWFLRFVEELLRPNAALRRLLRRDPFDGEPPTYIRARLFRYRFTTRDERRETGAWWVREPSGAYLPAVSLETFGRA